MVREIAKIVLRALRGAKCFKMIMNAILINWHDQLKLQPNAIVSPFKVKVLPVVDHYYCHGQSYFIKCVHGRICCELVFSRLASQHGWNSDKGEASSLTGVRSINLSNSFPSLPFQHISRLHPQPLNDISSKITSNSDLLRSISWEMRFMDHWEDNCVQWCGMFDFVINVKISIGIASVGFIPSLNIWALI